MAIHGLPVVGYFYVNIESASKLNFFSRAIWCFLRTRRQTPDIPSFRITSTAVFVVVVVPSCHSNTIISRRRQGEKNKNVKNNLEAVNSVCRYFILIGRRESRFPSTSN